MPAREVAGFWLVACDLAGGVMVFVSGMWEARKEGSDNSGQLVACWTFSYRYF
jgi:hypothetical protein